MHVFMSSKKVHLQNVRVGFNAKMGHQLATKCGWPTALSRATSEPLNCESFERREQFTAFFFCVKGAMNNHIPQIRSRVSFRCYRLSIPCYDP